MTYASDIILNFLDGQRIYEFFEWQKKDFCEHIKKIPIFRIDSIIMEDFITNKIKVNTEFLNIIKNKTEVYNISNNTKLKYTTLLTSNEKVIGVEFDDIGNLICKSSLVLDEEEELLDVSESIEKINIKYKIIKKNSSINYNTRKEEYIKNILLQDLKDSLNTNNYSKIKYLYDEVFSKELTDINEMYYKLTYDIINNFSKKHFHLYSILRFINIKK